MLLGSPGEEGNPGPRDTAPTPSLRLSLDFQTYLQQQNEETVQEVPRMVGKDNQKPHIRIHRMSSSSMEKQQKLFYTEEPDSSNPISPASQRQEDRAHLRHPTNWGIMDRAATGPEDAKPPTAQVHDVCG